MGRILAIDYGLKRVGLAHTDDCQMIATPLATISTSVIFQYLIDYFEKEDVESIVIGDPKTLDDKPTVITNKIKVFNKKLSQIFQKPIYLVDERFTSKIALKAIVSMGVKKKKRRNKSLVDKISATLILQSYLNRKKRDQ